MDQQIWSFFWALAALSLAVAFHFLWEKRSRISNGASQSEFQAENPMSAPSSSSNSALPVEYEVFLSFRGPDVRTTFADVLYKFLDHSKIRTFFDDEELRKGEIIAPSLVKAIMESKVYIPIISPGYASSKWCLQELALMVKFCKQGDGRIILPIFYMMEPRDVRHQEGFYKEAFRLHCKKYDAETMKEWKEALKEVGDMKGWFVKESDRQGDIMEKVYSKVWSHLMSSYKLVTDELVGIDSHVQQVKRLLSSESEVKIVGIYGMGGIGKTTITKVVYNELCSQFDRFCFVEDAREILLKSDGIVTLQSKIIVDILRIDYNVKDASEGLHIMKDRVCKHKVLVVLDDVNDSFEFDQIMGKLDNFSPDSRFIITTRDKRVLQVLQECKFYEPGEMSNDHALQLFSKHAFGIDVPPTDYTILSLEFVQVATGLPLALKVVGSLLFRREREIWAAKLMELKDIPPTKLQKRLKVSYNELSDNEKQIFLDIACFFIGEEKDFPFYMWSDYKLYPESGINTLLLRSLVRLNERNEFWMHDHIRDLGRAIVREEDSQHSWKRSRIWSNEDALDILKSEEGSDRVEVLRVDLHAENLELTDKEFKKLSKLRYLQVCFGSLIGDFKGVLPNIRWLRLVCCSSIPSNVNMKKLVILEMQNCPVKDDWRGWSGTKVGSNLKAIHLRYCEDPRTAPDLSQCRNIEWIDLRGCSEMSGEIHIGNLKNLKLLRFSWTKITKLIGEIGTLENLHVLDAGDLRFPSNNRKLFSPEILNLPTSLNHLSLSSSRVLNLSELKDLEELCFSKCDKLQNLGGLWKLSKLRKLKLNYLSCCNSILMEEEGSSTGFPLPSSLNSIDISGLESLPNFANLNNLTNLTLTEFQVPEIQGLGDLIMLETLVISDAQNLINLDGLESLSHLKTLKLQNCSVLENLPISLANLTKLHELWIYFCPLLSDIRGLEKLRVFSLSSLCIGQCPSLEAADCLGLTHDLLMEPLMPSLWKLVTLTSLSLSGNMTDSDHVPSREQFMDLSSLQNIEKITIAGYKQLSKVYGLHKWKSLKSLSLLGCTAMRELPDGLENLRYLTINGCTSIVNFPACLSCLEELNINGCTQLTEVMSLERLEALRLLIMRDCTSITKFPDLSALMNLRMLNISGCTGLTEIMGIKRLESLPDLSVLMNLKTLDISGCTGLTDVSGVERLECLEVLDMSGCSSVEELPDLSGLRNLVRLYIGGCNQLKEVTGIESMELLEYLFMTNCTLIKKLPDLSGCKKLCYLVLAGCVQLAEVRGVERLESLQQLRMSHCSAVKELPDLSGLQNIVWLEISECNQLKEVTWIENLELLEILEMTNCTLVKKLPDLSGCKKLCRLDIRGCVQLAEVRGIDKLKGLTVQR